MSLPTFDAEDIAASCRMWIWDELVNTYKIPVGTADIVSSQVEYLVKEAVTELENEAESA